MSTTTSFSRSVSQSAQKKYFHTHSRTRVVKVWREGVKSIKSCFIYANKIVFCFLSLHQKIQIILFSTVKNWPYSNMTHFIPIWRSFCAPPPSMQLPPELNNPFLWSPYVIGQTIYIFIQFLSSSSFFSSPNLSGRRLDVYHTLAHGVALVRI